MNSKRDSIKSILIYNILPAVGWTMIILSIALEFGSRNSMGIYRDLVVRNRNFQIIFNPNIMISLRVGIIIMASMILLFFKPSKHNEKKIENINKRAKKYSMNSFIFSLLWIFMSFYKSEWTAYPWVLLSILVMTIIQYIRLLHFLKFKERENNKDV